MKRKAGDQIVLTHGEYSNFGIVGHFRVLKDFDQGDLVEAFIKVINEDCGGKVSYLPHHQFARWASVNGFIEDLSESKEFYLGDYDLSPAAARTNGYGFDRQSEDI